MAASLVLAPTSSWMVKPKSPSSFRAQSLPSKRFQNARIGFGNRTNKAENSNATHFRKINLVSTLESTRMMTPILPRLLLLPLAATATYLLAFYYDQRANEKADASDDESASEKKKLLENGKKCKTSWWLRIFYWCVGLPRDFYEQDCQQNK